MASVERRSGSYRVRYRDPLVARGAGRSGQGSTPTASPARSRATRTAAPGLTGARRRSPFRRGLRRSSQVAGARADVPVDLSAGSRAARPPRLGRPPPLPAERRGGRAVARRRAGPLHLAVVDAPPLPHLAPRPPGGRREGPPPRQPVRQGSPAQGPDPVSERRIPYFKIGGKLRFGRREIHDWVDSQTRRRRRPDGVVAPSATPASTVTAGDAHPVRRLGPRRVGGPRGAPGTEHGRRSWRGLRRPVRRVPRRGARSGETRSTGRDRAPSPRSDRCPARSARPPARSLAATTCSRARVALVPTTSAAARRAPASRPPAAGS